MLEVFLSMFAVWGFDTCLGVVQAGLEPCCFSVQSTEIMGVHWLLHQPHLTRLYCSVETGTEETQDCS